MYGSIGDGGCVVTALDLVRRLDAACITVVVVVTDVGPGVEKLLLHCGAGLGRLAPKICLNSKVDPAVSMISSWSCSSKRVVRQ